MALSQFATLNDQENAKLLTDEDSENTKRSTKVWKTLFEEYLKQKQRNYPQNAIELAEILKLFYAEARYLPTGVSSCFLSSF